MSDEDLEIIPILEDVLVAGDLDKAVTGDIDVNDLESIERFDALFETQQPHDNENDLDDKTPEENLASKSTGNETILESKNDDSFYSPDLDLLSEKEHQDENVAYDSKTESLDYETQSTDTSNVAISNEDVGNEIETESFEPVKAEDNSAFIEETNELADSNQALINQALDEDDDIDVQEITGFQDEVTSEPEISEAAIITEPEQQSLEPTNQETTSQEPTNQEAEIDLCEIVDKVTQDIMPELETQIRSLVLTSLEKHLSDSINISMPDSNTDTDKDL